MLIQIINKNFPKKILILLLIIISSLYGKCPNAEFFLVRIFPYSDWIRRFTPCSVDNDRNRICRTGCNLLVACHASNTRRGGVYIYFKHHLPAIKRNKLYCLKECLFTELKLGKKQYFFHMHIYITSSQTSDEFENSVWTLTYSYLIIAILIYDSCWCSC